MAMSSTYYNHYLSIDIKDILVYCKKAVLSIILYQMHKCHDLTIFWNQSECLKSEPLKWQRSLVANELILLCKISHTMWTNNLLTFFLSTLKRPNQTKKHVGSFNDSRMSDQEASI